MVFVRIKDEEYADLDEQGKLKKEGEETKGAVKLQYSKVIPAVSTPLLLLSLISSLLSLRRFVKLWSRMWITMRNWMYWEKRLDLMKTKEQLHSRGQMQLELLVWYSPSYCFGILFRGLSAELFIFIFLVRFESSRRRECNSPIKRILRRSVMKKKITISFYHR